MLTKSISRRNLILTGCALPAVAMPGMAAMARPQMKHTQLSVPAPFDMPSISVPDFSASRHFIITDYGALPDDKRRNKIAISKAISEAHSAGSGVVVVPPGTWEVGSIHLRSNVNLHLAKGATLLFSDDPKDYLPAVQTSWEGIECFNYSPLIYAFNCRNVAITGSGTLQARLDLWKIWYARPKSHMDALVELYQLARHNVAVAKRQMATGEKNLRPHFIQFNRCQNVLVEDVSIVGSPFWTLHPLLCRDVVIRRLNVFAHGHNNDGVDPEMSQNVLIEDCKFDQGDDAVSVKSGRDMDAWRLGIPAKNIVMRSCRIVNGHQMMAVGSELSAGIENVVVDDCHFVGNGEMREGTTVPMNNLLFVKTNERRGGYVKNIHMSRVTATTLEGGVLAVATDVLYQWKTLLPTYQRRLTPIRDIHVSDVNVGTAQFRCSILGEADMPIRDVTLEKVKVKTLLSTPLMLRHVEKFAEIE